MARAHVMRPIIGENGDLLYGARVSVREAGQSVKIGQTLYAGPTGTEQLPNPHVTEQGVVDFWLEEAQRVSVLVQHDQHSDILVYLDAAPPPEETARSASPLLIAGEQVPGYVLLAGENPGEAVWGSPPANSGVTPQVTVINESFSMGQDPAGWTFTQAATTTRDYSYSVPENQGLLRSLHAAHTGDAGSLAIVSPGFTLAEAGFVSLWLRPRLVTGEAVAIAITDQGGTKTVLETITELRDWGFYRYPVSAGTYQSLSIEFTGSATFTGSSGHEMWVTGLRALYGGHVPAHDHEGSGADSVLLGVGAEASGTASVAIGASASATADHATAMGYGSAAAGLSSVAVGVDAQAPAADATAVGARASGEPGATGWTAIGADAYADGDNATAVGSEASVNAADGTALGTRSYVGPLGTNGVAIGDGAQALGSSSVAIGAGSVVAETHGSAVAIGPGAATSATGQVMLGNPSYPFRAVVIANALHALSSVNFGTDATSRIGFFGAEGTVQPVVTGSDGGVEALRNLLGALAGLGLIANETTN